jgi:hypothetical protein
MGLLATGLLVFFSDMDASWIGFGIMFLMNFAAYLSFMIRMGMQINLNMSSTERIIKYTTL